MRAPDPFRGRLCRAEGCGAEARPGHLMCRPCWYLVPRAQRHLVHKAWRVFKAAPFGTDRIVALRAYRRVVDEAVAAVREARP